MKIHSAHLGQSSTRASAIAEFMNWQKQLRNSGVHDFFLPQLLLQEIAPKALVVVVHGLGETSRSMSKCAQYLYKNGFDVLNLLLSGHGIEPGALEATALFDWRADIQTAVSIASGLSPCLIACGFSLGGSLVLDHWLSNPHSFQGILLKSPGLAMSSWWDNRMISRRNKKMRWTSDSRLGLEFGYQQIPVVSTEHLDQLIADLEAEILASKIDKNFVRSRCKIILSENDDLLNSEKIKSLSVVLGADLIADQTGGHRFLSGNDTLPSCLEFARQVSCEVSLELKEISATC